MSNDSVTAENSFCIRKMTDADIARVADLEKEIFPDPWPRSSFDEIIDDSSWGNILADADGEIIGYACYMIDGHESRLANIAVAPIWRRKSVAKQLLQHILELVTESGCKLVLLEVRPSNAEARKLYGEFGFRDLYQKPNYYRRTVEDALVMVRYLEDD